MRERLRAVRLLLAFPFKVDTYRTAGALLLIFCGQLAGVGVAIGLALTTDGAVTRSGDRAIPGIAIFCVSALLSSLGNWGSFVLQTNLLDRATLAVDLELVQLTCSIEGIEHLERPEYLDRIEHLNQNRQNLVTVPTRAATILASGLRLALTVVLLARVEPLLALLVLAGIPLLLASTRRNRKLIQVWDEVGSPTMRLQYVLRHIAGQESGAREIRVFGIQEEFKRGYTRLWNTFTAAFDRVSLGGALLEALAAAFLALAVGFGLVLVAHQADSGAVTAGNLVLVLTLISQINLHLGILAGTANSVGGSLQTAERLLWLREYAAHDGSPDRNSSSELPASLSSGIELAHVSYRYAGADADALHDVDLFIPFGSSVAIVGENGAGKSTLVKLLLRMYQPSAGSILIDGVQLGDVSTGQWRSLTSATFQDFVKFEFLLRESVGVGQLDFVDETAAVLGALQRGEASELAQIRSIGLETQLGRNFADGIELSGGQWQKIAVSRSMMRESPLLLVLDEPAASLDATTEAALFEHLTGAARRASRNAGAVSLFVSHRFGTARNADLIVVLNQGRVVETGNHATLMGNGGYYAELFQLQARSYQ